MLCPAPIPLRPQVIIGNPDLKANHNITQHVEVVSDYEKMTRLRELLKSVMTEQGAKVGGRLAGWLGRVSGRSVEAWWWLNKSSHQAWSDAGQALRPFHQTALARPCCRHVMPPCRC